MLIRIIPVGRVNEKILESLQNSLPDLLNCKTKIEPAVEMVQQAFNAMRRQYDAEKVLRMLTAAGIGTAIEKNVPALFVCNEDLYYNGLNFVFGLEETGVGAAIVSVHRLRTEFYGERPSLGLLQERIVKEAVHEIGHVLGLEHDAFSKCAMAFSPSVADVDRKENNFCRTCRDRLSESGIEVG